MDLDELAMAAEGVDFGTGYSMYMQEPKNFYLSEVSLDEQTKTESGIKWYVERIFKKEIQRRVVDEGVPKVGSEFVRRFYEEADRHLGEFYRLVDEAIERLCPRP